MFATAKRPVFARFTEEERPHVEKIVSRATTFFRDSGVQYSSKEVEMDLAAVHARVPLRLADLATADDFNFSHDLAGIYRHLNRTTGLLDGRFLPRFAAWKS